MASADGRQGRAVIWQSNTLAGGSDTALRSGSNKKLYIILGLVGGAAAGVAIGGHARAASSGPGGGGGTADHAGRGRGYGGRSPMKRWTRVAAAALLCAGAAAAESGINGPVSGFVLDARSRSLRPVNGMPGAALLGAPLAIPFQVRLAAVAARRDFALVAGIEDDSPAMLVRGLAQAAPEISGIEGAISGASRMALSGGGAAAVLYSAGRGQMQALTGLPDQPRAGDLVDVSGLGEITALAVDDSGARIFAGTADGVYLVAADGEARRLAGGAGVAAIATANNGRDLVFASQASNEIVHSAGRGCRRRSPHGGRGQRRRGRPRGARRRRQRIMGGQSRHAAGAGIRPRQPRAAPVHRPARHTHAVRPPEWRLSSGL